MKHNLIKIRGLSKSFIGNTIFNNVNLSVGKGKNLTIIGGSGQGKSVLLKCIMGLIEPDDGDIFYDGNLLNKKNKGKFINDLGTLFQGGALFDSLPVWENISFKFKYNRMINNKERRKLAKKN